MPTNSPFFSILIPTRNRPKLCNEAIKSVLAQSFSDYEVLISNNGSDSRTKALAVGACASNDRFNYVEFDNLPMHVHWEQALTRLNGRYLIILTDRCLLFRDSLQTIHQEIQLFGYPQIASWKMAQYDDETGVLIHGCSYNANYPGSTEICDPLSIFIDEIRSRNQNWSEKIPRGLDSAVSLSLITQLKHAYANVFHPISPDFTFATLCLLNADTMIFIDRPLYISSGASVSNGSNAYSGAVSDDFIASIGREYDWFEHVPSNVMFVTNAIFDDYLRIAKICRHDELNKYFNIRTYYYRLLDELKAKVDRALISKEDLSRMASEIASSVSDEKLKDEIAQAARLIIAKYKQYTFKKLLVSLASVLAPWLSARVKRFHLLKAGKGVYFKSALAATQGLSR